MNRDTYEKLCKMRLPEMASQYRKHAESPELYAAMTFDEEFELLVDAEFDARTNNKIKRLLKNSSIPDTTAHIGGIEFLPERHLNQDLFSTLQTNDYISRGLNIMLIGATGSGKTRHISHALLLPMLADMNTAPNTSGSMSTSAPWRPQEYRVSTMKRSIASAGYH